MSLLHSLVALIYCSFFLYCLQHSFSYVLFALTFVLFCTQYLLTVSNLEFQEVLNLANGAKDPVYLQPKLINFLSSALLPSFLRIEWSFSFCTVIMSLTLSENLKLCPKIQFSEKIAIVLWIFMPKLMNYCDYETLIFTIWIFTPKIVNLLKITIFGAKTQIIQDFFPS